MKKLLTIVLSLVLVFSMTAVSFADTTTSYENMDTVTVSKTYKLTNAGTKSPAETFSFSALTCVSVTDAAAGVTTANAPVPTIGTVSYEAGEAGKDTATKNIEIKLPAYSSVGVYTYTFTENDGQTAGVTYRKEAIKLVVTVIEQNGLVKVAAVHTEGANEAKSGAFNNEYSAGTLTVGKTVTGLLGDKTKDFKVTVTFTAPSGDTVKEAIVYGNNTIEPSDWENGVATAEITLKHGDTVGFTNIPYGVTYTVAEADYTGDGYDAAAYEFDDTNKKIDSASENVQITNNKGGNVDTGIIMDNGIYILLLAGAAAGVGLFIARRRNSFES